MDLTKHPEMLDRLAGGYALGSLRGGARRRFEALAREQAPVRAAALLWQARLASMNELQPRSDPGPAVWTRIDNLLQGEKEAMTMAPGAQPSQPPRVGQQRSTSGWFSSLLLWRGAALAGALATLLAVVTGLNLREHLGQEIEQLQAKLLAAPQIEYVAVLSDDQANASVLVTFNASNKTLTLQRLGGYQEAGDRSLQLWALPPSGGPRSLGVLGSDKLLRLKAAERDMREIPTLAISLEPKGGVPGERGPTGPVLFKGALLRHAL